MKTFSKSLIAISVLSTASISSATEGLYFGLNIGQASYDVSLSDAALLDDGSLSSASLDDSDTSLSLTVGYQMTPNFSIEGGYIDLGEFSFDATSNGSGWLYPAGPVNATIETTGLFFDVKGQVPLTEKISLYGKLGLLKWDADVNVSISLGSGSESIDDTDTFIGMGGSVILSQDEASTIALNVDYTLYELDDLDVDVFSVGIQIGY